LLENIDKDTIIKNYEGIINQITLNSPGTQIYIQSILPVSSGTVTSPGFKIKEMNEKINNLNDKLLALSSKYHLKYIDVAKTFMANGELNPGLTFDGVHLNGKGYLLWRDILKPYMEE
ncbi:MAG: GDSL-type esterase/lipase family protein, partial [Bacteroidia bacterium]